MDALSTRIHSLPASATLAMAAKARELKNKGIENKVVVCMRYWHPMTPEVVAKVKDYNPDKIFLLPLYPQYSTTTTKSSLDAWFNEAQKQELNEKKSLLQKE